MPEQQLEDSILEIQNLKEWLVKMKKKTCFTCCKLVMSQLETAEYRNYCDCSLIGLKYKGNL